ncbi:hypothetical protein CDV31_006589 [Fusarium ambrosium]|uniref:Uncharacterized protein n=1 Tax=Fusarium ambrosium TaxID=131363 RepID=A0A428UC19_9HYPO|nr:hypothetical protein CDV31_006589 [Fusarium ambrosium]
MWVADYLSLLITCQAMSQSDMEGVEQCFLDISVDQVLHYDGVPAVEPWATMYIDAIHDKRFGDAIWARYQIFGDVVDGLIDDGRLTVLESIEEDAVGYKKNAPEAFDEAVAFYKSVTNSADGHPEVIEIIMRIDKEDVSNRYFPEGG